jgi:ubiquinol-cytochrome c reductase cytochrome b subunit
VSASDAPRRDQPPPGTDAVAFVDERLGASPFLKKALRYVFPEHWSFLLGEIALYSFVVLVATGIFLACFFNADEASMVTYDGPYKLLAGRSVTKAYDSALGLSFDVPGGLLMRQTHHWAALIFIAAIVLHLMRVFFTGAFRRPRQLIWAIGVTLLGLGVFEGFAGYSLPDDLLSGMGLAIAYGVALSIPFVGGDVGSAVWDGQYPGSGTFHDRLYLLHILIVPMTMAALIGAHLALITRTHHTQFRGPGRREDNVVGAPTWPTYALRSLGLLCATAAVLFLLGGLVQINPIVILYAIPAVERRLTGDRQEHHLLDRPRDHPWRTAFGAALFTWVSLIFIAGSADRMFLQLGWSYESEVWIFRVLSLVAPIVVFFGTRAVCDELRRSGTRPLRGMARRRIRRTERGGFEVE